MAQTDLKPTVFTQCIQVRLDKTNFILWQAQILPIIRGHGLMHYLDGTIPPPNQFTLDKDGKTQLLNPDFIFWTKQDQLILAFLFQSISETVLAQIATCSTSFEVWQSIQRSFSSQSLIRTIELRRQLLMLEKGNLNCSDYLARIKQYIDQLNSVGEVVSDHETLIYVFKGLGPEFNPVMATLEERQTPPTFPELQSKLRNYEAFLTQQQQQQSSAMALFTHSSHTSMASNSSGGFQNTLPLSSNGTNGSLNYSINSSPSNSSGQIQNSLLGPVPNNVPNSPMAYYSAHSQNFNNHNQAHSNSQPQNHNNNTNNYRKNNNTKKFKPKVSCQICHKNYHTADKCFYRFDPALQPRNPPPPNQHNNRPYQPQTYLSETRLPTPTPPSPYTNPPHEWFFDSGSTHHVTADHNNLSNFSPYYGSSNGASTSNGPHF